MIAILRHIAKAFYHLGQALNGLSQRLEAFCDRHTKGGNENGE
jgi:hypothetical protein